MKKYIYAISLLLFCLSAAAQVQTREVFYPKDSAKTGFAGTYGLKTKGYICNIELGNTDIFTPVTLMNADTPIKSRGALPLFSINIVNSYLITPYASIGLGAGTEISGNHIETFSLYADSRTYFIKSNISPFFEAAFGYNAMFWNRNLPDAHPIVSSGPIVFQGMMVNPALGIRVATGRKFSVTASIGYKLYYLHEGGAELYENISAFAYLHSMYSLGQALTIKAGFQF